MKTEDGLINFAYHICHVKSVKEPQTLKSKTEVQNPHYICSFLSLFGMFFWLRKPFYAPCACPKPFTSEWILAHTWLKVHFFPG